MYSQGLKASKKKSLRVTEDKETDYQHKHSQKWQNNSFFYCSMENSIFCFSMEKLKNSN